MAAGRLQEAGVENEEFESGYLLDFACGTNRSFYLLHKNEEMPGEAEVQFFALVAQRCLRIPLQQLTGEQEFMGLPFVVNKDVLIPRQDTELLCETAIAKINERSKKGAGLRILDLCTGSGCIAVSLKAFCPAAEVVAVDVSPAALVGAKGAAEWNQTGIGFLEGDLFASVQGGFDFIVSNPPYIPAGIIRELMPEVSVHEPVLALDGGADGLAFYRRIAAESVGFLRPGAELLLEIGHDQAAAVSGLLEAAQFEEITIRQDLAGLDRVVSGRRA